MPTRYGGMSIGKVMPFTNKSYPTRAITAHLEVIGSLLEKSLKDMNVSFESVPTPAHYEIFENVTAQQQMDSLFSGLNINNSVKVWFNNRGWAALPAYLNVMSNALLRSKIPTHASSSEYGIFTYNHPMNSTTAEIDILGDPAQQAGKQFFEIVLISLAFSIIPSSFVLFMIDERINHAKHLQHVTGVTPLLYWLANFAWDMVNYTIPVLLCYIIFLIFNEETFVSSFALFSSSFTLFMFYGFAIVLLMYPFVFVFRIPSLAFISLGIGNFFISIVTTLTTFVLDGLENNDPELKLVNDICKKVFLAFPQYLLGRGLILIKLEYYSWKFKEDLVGKTSENPDPWDQIGAYIGYLLIQGSVAFAILMLIEYRASVFKIRCGGKKVEQDSSSSRGGIDDDVVEERNRVLAGQADDSALKIRNLSKVYSGKYCWSKGFQAVDNLCIGVDKGECFGLLGVNGAGKTTTFKMLTGKTSITDGEAAIYGASVKEEFGQVQQLLGYCPQFDALNARLTGRETLLFYARIRGIDDDDARKVVKWAIEHMQLTNYADAPTGQYSGGNKRKLSTAIALIGNPPLVLLDEPTTGMDAKARRFCWNRIIDVVKEGRSVILTSHSMEECETLCNRIGIMVSGRLQCLGTLQHLKQKFGEGYTLTLKFKSKDNEVLSRGKAWMKSNFPLSQLTDEHNAVLHYQIPQENLKLSKIFRGLEENREELMMEDYTLSQTSLDQVFIQFASEHYKEAAKLNPPTHPDTFPPRPPMVEPPDVHRNNPSTQPTQQPPTVLV